MSNKIRKAADASLGVGLGITNGATNGNPPKRRKVEKGPSGGAVMERSMSGLFGSSGVATKGKGGSPRDTPGPEGSKKRSRGVGTTNGQIRKRFVPIADLRMHSPNNNRNNTVTSVAMSPSLASSPIRSTFPDSKSGRPSPPPANGRPTASRARQNSTQSVNEKRPASAASNKPNGTATPDLGAAASATGRTIAEVKSSMKETTNSKGEHFLEDTEQDNPEMVGGLVIGNRKDSIAKREGSPHGTPRRPLQTTNGVIRKERGLRHNNSLSLSRMPRWMTLLVTRRMRTKTRISIQTSRYTVTATESVMGRWWGVMPMDARGSGSIWSVLG